MDIKELIAAILCGLAILIAVMTLLVLTLGSMAYSAHENNFKDQHMVKLCIDHGYRGWDSGQSDQDARYEILSCVK